MPIDVLLKRDLAGGRYKAGQVISCNKSYADDLVRNGDGEPYFASIDQEEARLGGRIPADAETTADVLDAAPAAPAEAKVVPMPRPRPLPR